jgi:CRP/FNR family transcriptional regulator
MLDKKVVATLQSLSYFRDLDLEQLEQVAAQLRVTAYSKGEIIFAQGERAKGLYCLIDGKVKAVRYSPEGKEHIIRFFLPIDTFNEVGALDGGVNPATAIAAENSRIMLLPTRTLRPLLEKSPAVDTRIMTNMAHKLRFAMKQVEQLSMLDVKERLMRFLLDQWKTGHQECCLSQEELAAMLGTVRQVLGRALADLANQGAIEVGRGRIRVLHPELLATVSEQE